MPLIERSRAGRHKGFRAGRFDVGHARILDRVGSHDQCRTHRRPFRRDSISGNNPSVGPETGCKTDGDLSEFRPVRPRAFQFPFPRRPRRHSDEFRIFLMGADLAYIFEQCGSLWPGITLHAINNISVVAYLMAT